jgi:hypothetical protein
LGKRCARLRLLTRPWPRGSEMYLAAKSVVDCFAKADFDAVEGLEVKDVGLGFLGSELVVEAVHGKYIQRAIN